MDTIEWLAQREPANEADIRSLFKRKNAWVVGGPRGAAAQYQLVLCNLSRHYVPVTPAAMDSVRDTLNLGLDRSVFDRLKTLTGASNETLCATIRVPLRTLARRRTFKPDESERILRVAAAFQRALETLGDLDAARRWFTTPKRALGNTTPLAFCDTEPGAQEVEHLLGRIADGVFS